MERTSGLIFLAAVSLLAMGCQPNCAHAVFPDPEDSPYVLPFPVGESYVVSQSYCNPLGGHRDRIAVDFMMPVGTTVVASRAGEVIEIVERFVDGDLSRGHNNRLLIRHEDGTIAWYAHLQTGGVDVDVGERVSAGQAVARSGNTGNTGDLPHLHFEVFRERAYDYADAMAISFRNARGPLDSRGGMVRRASYEALPWHP